MSKELSNAEKGKRFTRHVQCYLEKSERHYLETEYKVKVSINGEFKKHHKFDLGNKSLLVECKRYTWTKGNRRIPVAKIATANEAMLYFAAVRDASIKKRLFMLETNTIELNTGKGHETLAAYYVRKNKHLFPSNVEVYELNECSLRARRVYPLDEAR